MKELLFTITAVMAGLYIGLQMVTIFELDRIATSLEVIASPPTTAIH